MSTQALKILAIIAALVLAGCAQVQGTLPHWMPGSNAVGVKLSGAEEVPPHEHRQRRRAGLPAGLPARGGRVRRPAKGLAQGWICPRTSPPLYLALCTLT